MTEQEFFRLLDEHGIDYDNVYIIEDRDDSISLSINFEFDKETEEE